MTTHFFCILLLLMTSLTACKRENPSPELIDPIYLDLKSELNSAEQSIAEYEKKIEEAKNNLEKSEPNSIDRKNAQKDLMSAQKAYTKSVELAEYYKIRTEQRLVAARIEYKKAFREDRAWPSKEAIEAYKTNKRLQNASRNWNQRLEQINKEKKVD